MSGAGAFGDGDFLRNMLGDLLRLIPSGAGVQWQLAYQLATQIASGQSTPPGLFANPGAPAPADALSDPNPDPLERIRFEELSTIAELHVTDATGMTMRLSGRPIRLVPATRSEWARRTLDTWRPVLDRMAEVLGPPGAPGTAGGARSRAAGSGGAGGAGAGPATPTVPDDLSGLEDLESLRDLDDLENRRDLTAGEGLHPSLGDRQPGAGDIDADPREAGLEDLFTKWATAMFPTMIAMQVGSVVGHLAERALGPYEVPLAPVSTEELAVVSANLSAVAADWSLPIDDLRLWLCAHELTYHAVLSRPAVAGRIAELVVRHAELVRPDAGALEEMLGQADVADLDALAQLFGDPAALIGKTAGAGAERVRAELDALMAAVAGYGEHVTSVVAARLIGNHAPIAEAMRRRRVGRGEGEKVAEALFGLVLDQRQIDRGERFVAGVLERSGEAQLSRMWNSAESLPTPAEVDAPGLWLARLGLDSG